MLGRTAHNSIKIINNMVAISNKLALGAGTYSCSLQGVLSWRSRILTSCRLPRFAYSVLFCVSSGCYWGTEKYIVKDFQKKYPGSVKDAKVGFMSPAPNAMVNPSYRQVSPLFPSFARSNSPFTDRFSSSHLNPALVQSKRSVRERQDTSKSCGWN